MNNLYDEVYRLEDFVGKVTYFVLEKQGTTRGGIYNPDLLEQSTVESRVDITKLAAFAKRCWDSVIVEACNDSNETVAIGEVKETFYVDRSDKVSIHNQKGKAKIHYYIDWITL